MAMLFNMLGPRQRFEVGYIVVQCLAVLVVNDLAARDGTVMCDPHQNGTQHPLVRFGDLDPGPAGAIPTPGTNLDRTDGDMRFGIFPRLEFRLRGKVDSFQPLVPWLLSFGKLENACTFDRAKVVLAGSGGGAVDWFAAAIALDETTGFSASRGAKDALRRADTVGFHLERLAAIGARLRHPRIECLLASGIAEPSAGLVPVNLALGAVKVSATRCACYSHATSLAPEPCEINSGAILVATETVAVILQRAKDAALAPALSSKGT